MITASLTLCKQLFAVSGWTGTLLSWYCDEERDDTPVVNLSEPLKVVGGVGHYDRQYPAYDVGYLVGMLPAHKLIKRGNATYIALWFDHTNSVRIPGESRTNPANALCHLAIALFEAGVLIGA